MVLADEAIDSCQNHLGDVFAERLRALGEGVCVCKNQQTKQTNKQNKILNLAMSSYRLVSVQKLPRERSKDWCQKCEVFKNNKRL